MRIDKHRQSLLDQRVYRLSVIDSWIDGTSDNFLLGELKWIRTKASEVHPAPKDIQKLNRDRAISRRHLKQMRESIPGGASHRTPWTEQDDNLVIDSTLPDRELAKVLGRSYSATQKRRHRLRELGLVPHVHVSVVHQPEPKS